MGADKNAESISQQMIQNETGKKTVEYGKNVIDVISIGNSAWKLCTTTDDVVKTIETTNIINTTTNELTNYIKNEEK